MKKMLFSAIAMIAFAGSAFASNEVVKEKALENEAVVEDDAPCKQWVTYKKTCGGEFHLCADHYATNEDLLKAVIHYETVQCRGLTPTDPGTGIQG